MPNINKKPQEFLTDMKYKKIHYYYCYKPQGAVNINH